MDNVQTLSQVDFEKEAGFCDTKWKVQANFKECDRVTTLPNELAVQSEILSNY